jgi:ribosomal protein S18 acetylase RimI-like enzyme
MDIRVLRPSDIPHVQLANITNLPENYFCKYYLYHAMSWPQLSYVAVDVSLLEFVCTIELPESGFGKSWEHYIAQLQDLEKIREKEWELGHLFLAMYSKTNSSKDPRTKKRMDT